MDTWRTLKTRQPPTDADANGHSHRDPPNLDRTAPPPDADADGGPCLLQGHVQLADAVLGFLQQALGRGGGRV